MNISWLKLDVNILDNSKIKIIRSYPDGDSIVVLWVGILCLAMKSPKPGFIEMSDGIPYSIDELAKLFDLEIKTIELGVSLLQKFKMIDIFDGGCIEVINFSKSQNIEFIERRRELTRVRNIKYREKQKLNDAPMTRHGVTMTLTDKKEKEIRKEITYNPTVSENFKLLWDAYPKKISKADAEKAWKKLNGSSPDIKVVIDAIKEQTECYVRSQGDNFNTVKWKFFPNASTWINGKKWEDIIEKPKKYDPWEGAQ